MKTKCVPQKPNCSLGCLWLLEAKCHPIINTPPPTETRTIAGLANGTKSFLPNTKSTSTNSTPPKHAQNPITIAALATSATTTKRHVITIWVPKQSFLIVLDKFGSAYCAKNESRRPIKQCRLTTSKQIRVSLTIFLVRSCRKHTLSCKIEEFYQEHPCGADKFSRGNPC